MKHYRPIKKVTPKQEVNHMILWDNLTLEQKETVKRVFSYLQNRVENYDLWLTKHGYFFNKFNQCQIHNVYDIPE